MPVASSTTARPSQHAGRIEVTAESADDRRCDVCPHPVVEHDGIALRRMRLPACLPVTDMLRSQPNAK
jgi:hypothetical protein